MQRDVLHSRLVAALEKKIPDKTKLIETLMDTLFMEKGAVNRRLRGEVAFSFFEVVNIAERLKLSISHFLTSKAMWIDNFIQDASGENIKVWQEYVDFAQMSKNDPDSYFTDATNLLPGSIFYKYDLMYKFYLFKYQYLLRGAEGRMSFNEFKVPESIIAMSHSYFQGMKNFAKTTYICDHMMIGNLITDIHYFSSINVLFEDDIRQIKDVLYDLLDYFERIALNGCFEETGNPADIYISDINLDTNYTYIKIHEMKITFVRTFWINTIMSRDKISFENITRWVQSLIKTSTLISRSAAVYRAEFFEKQRKIVSGL